MEVFAGSPMIDAAENRYVAIFDAPGAYLWAEMIRYKTVLVKFEG